MDNSPQDTGPNNPISDRLITLSAAHRQLGVSRSKLYKMLDADEIPQPIKIGRRAFFSARELQAWIADQLAMRTNGGAQ